MTKAEKAIYDREYRAKNRDRLLAGKKAWYYKNRDRALEQCRRNYPTKAKQVARRATAWNKANPERKRAINRKYNNRRWATNPNARLIGSLRNRVRAAMKGIAKTKSTTELIGCSVEDFMDLS